jgi:hypothetical protein
LAASCIGAAAQHLHCSAENEAGKEIALTHEEDESLIDRVRNAFGRDTDDDRSTVVNRPAGPDYAAEETIDADFSAGLARADTTHDFDAVEVTTDGLRDDSLQEPR